MTPVEKRGHPPFLRSTLPGSAGWETGDVPFFRLTPTTR